MRLSSTKLLLACAAATALFASAGDRRADAQPFDHLTCTRVRDMRNAPKPPPLTLTPAQVNFLASTGCQVRTRTAKASEICIPSSKSPGGPPGGLNLGAQDFLCYKVNCANNGGGETPFQVVDQFGSGNVSVNEKHTQKKLCVPAFAPGGGPPAPTPSGPTPTPAGPTPTPGIGGSCPNCLTPVFVIVQSLIGAVQALVATVQLLLSGCLLLVLAVPGIGVLIALLDDILQVAQNLLALLQVFLGATAVEQCALIVQIKALAGELLALLLALPAVLNPLLANPLTAPIAAAAQALLTLITGTVVPLLQALLAHC